MEVLFEPEPHLSDSLTYDITAWSLPFAYGLEAYALKDRLESKKSYEPYQAPPVRLAASPYAWCVHRRSLAEAVFIGELLQQGVKVRTATQSFSMADQRFAPGAFVINRADNRYPSGDLDQIVQAAAAKANVPLHPIFTGFSGSGNDLGSEAFPMVSRPEVAIVYGDEVDDNSFGHTWFFFERELRYPVAQVPVDKLHKVKLGDFNTLVFPDGYYSLSESQLKIIEEWAKNGGRIIAFEGGARAFADKDGFDLKMKAEPKKDSTDAPKPYRMRERERISDQLPGAIVKAKTDNSHPLAFGLPEVYFSLKTSSNAYQMPEKAVAAVYLEDSYQSYGFIGSRVKPKLKKTPVAMAQRMGDGQAIFFIDNPLFRCFWEQGKMLFANAVFY